LQKFYFIQFPEQFFFVKQNIDDAIPLLPIFNDLDDFSRIVASLQRWNRPCAVFYERTAYPFKDFLQKSSLFDSIFTFDATVAKTLRETGFSGKLFLFSNFRMLLHEGFYKEFNIRPVVSGKANFELANEKEINPLFMVSDKMCLADFGLCVSRKSTPQCSFNCDNRCREKSLSKQGVEFPLSIKPETTVPENTDCLIFSEKIKYFPLKTEKLKDQILESSWNHRYPVGHEIIKPGKTANGKNYTFSIDKKTEKLIEKGLIDFFGYSGSIHKGKWVNSSKIKMSGNDKISVLISESFQNVLMIQRYTEEEKELFKKGRHFIFTLPQKTILEKVVESEMDIPKNNENPSVGKYSKRMRFTLISDDIKRFNAFKGRDIQRKVLIYSRNIHSGFSDYLFIDGGINDKDISEISAMTKLKGIVVPDGIMKEAFERLLPDKEILLHPLSYYDSGHSPSFLSASTTIFVSKFRSEKRNNYGWPDINIFLNNKSGFTEFISKRKLSRTGGKKELWINIAHITDEALKYLKSQAESFSRKRR